MSDSSVVGAGERSTGKVAGGGGSHISVILGGDFNSTPGSEPVKIITSLFSTCACVYDLSVQSRSNGSAAGVSNDGSVVERYLVGSYFGGPNTKFLCDRTLSKLCRWLRVLGLDCAMYRPPSDQPGATVSATTITATGA